MASLVQRLFFLSLSVLAIGCPADDAFAPSLEDTLPGQPDVLGPVDTFTPDDCCEPDAGDPGIPSLVCGAAPSPSSPFPANEPGVRITSPTGQGTVLYAGGTLALGGVAFGDVAQLRWERGSESGPIPVAAFWSAPGISLQPGDNSIRVVATDSDGTEVSDTVVITSRPAAALLGDVRLQAYPDSLFRDEVTAVQFTVRLDTDSVDQSQVNLYRVNADGTDVSPTQTVKMRDDGELDEESRCDTVPGDRVYSACQQLTPSNDETFCYRVRVSGLANGQAVETPTRCLSLAQRITASQCLEIKQLLTTARSRYAGEASHEDGLNAALAELTAGNVDLETVASGRAAGDLGVWFRLANGLQAALPLGIPSGYRASPQSRQALLHHPVSSPEQGAVAPYFNRDECPPWSPTGPLQSASASVSTLRDLSRYGVVVFTGHGGAFFDAGSPDARHQGLQEVWWTGENISCEGLSDAPTPCSDDTDCTAGSHCINVQGATGQCRNDNQIDLALGRVAMSDTVYGILPGFIEQYTRGALPGSLIWASACNTAYNGSIAMSFLANGAASYVGYDGLVRDPFATAVAAHTFERLVSQGQTTGEAICFTNDPATPATAVRLFGSTATTLDASGIINAGYEDSDAAGWSVSGNARQLSSFCGIDSEFGSAMSLTSTGLGGAGLSGRWSQTFCIPEGTNTLSFYWQYLTSEPEALCGGDKYADRWRVTLSKPDGTSVDVKSCNREDMCNYDVGLCQPKPCGPPSDCGCGACYVPTTTLDTCTFEGQPVTTTGFVQESFNVSAFAGGGPITLEIDMVGDALNPSALLLDNIEFD